MFAALAELLHSQRLEVEIFGQLENNHRFWQEYDGNDFDHKMPCANREVLHEAYKRLNPAKDLTEFLLGGMPRTPKNLSASSFSSEPDKFSQPGTPRQLQVNFAELRNELGKGMRPAKQKEVPKATEKRSSSKLDPPPQE